MSETRGIYRRISNELEQQRQDILDDPTASDWLKEAVVTLLERDKKEALHDLERLRQLLEP